MQKIYIDCSRLYGKDSVIGKTAIAIVLDDGSERGQNPLIEEGIHVANPLAADRLKNPPYIYMGFERFAKPQGSDLVLEGFYEAVRESERLCSDRISDLYLRDDAGGRTNEPNPRYVPEEAASPSHVKFPKLLEAAKDAGMLVFPIFREKGGDGYSVEKCPEKWIPTKGFAWVPANVVKDTRKAGADPESFFLREIRERIDLYEKYTDLDRWLVGLADIERRGDDIVVTGDFEWRGAYGESAAKALAKTLVKGRDQKAEKPAGKPGMKI